MNYKDLCSHFGGPTETADALGMKDRRQVATWKKRRIPSRWQIKAQAVSEGKLTADRKARKEAAEISADFARTQQVAAAPA